MAQREAILLHDITTRTPEKEETGMAKMDDQRRFHKMV